MPAQVVLTPTCAACISAKAKADSLSHLYYYVECVFEFLNQNNDEKIFGKFVNDFYFFNDAFKNIHKIGI